MLEYQHRVLSIALPNSKFIVVTTCDSRKNFKEYIALKSYCKLNKLEILEIETKRHLFQYLYLNFFSLFGIRSIILRTPRVRQKWGQDPSSGHARALNRVLKKSAMLQENTEISIFEGDVFPLNTIKSLPPDVDFEGSVSHVSDKNISYFNGRIFRYRISSKTKKLIQSGKLKFDSIHTFSEWFDTGSSNYWIFKQNAKKDNTIKINIFDVILNNMWNFELISKLDSKFPGFLYLAQHDPRANGINCAFDFYDLEWIHIGNASGYITYNNPVNFGNLISQTANFALSQVNRSSN